jgi:hypothetical protein
VSKSAGESGSLGREDRDTWERERKGKREREREREKHGACTVGKWVGNMSIDLFVQHSLHGTCVAVSDSVGIF